MCGLAGPPVSARGRNAKSPFGFPKPAADAGLAILPFADKPPGDSFPLKRTEKISHIFKQIDVTILTRGNGKPLVRDLGFSLGPWP